MNKNVTIIPPSEDRPAILRVAAYCRVSTDSDDQATSYASQIRSYTELISQHEGWELVDIYADEAVSGTKTDKREDFNRLLADCRKGKIDRVLVKSISRFSRNTKDCLAALRELMRLGVTVQFEKENIDTGTLTTELMVSVSGSLAQQESMSISQNIRMGYRRRMERGEFIASSPPYGYRNAGGGRLEIVPEEAEVIRWVFESYLNGQGIVAIAEEMNRRGVPKKHGEAAWIPYAVACWLRNEKYTGNTLCQKTFTTGFPYISVKNRGEVDQFYIENSHPAIISQEIFDKHFTALLTGTGQIIGSVQATKAAIGMGRAPAQTCLSGREISTRPLFGCTTSCGSMRASSCGPLLTRWRLWNPLCSGRIQPCWRSIGPSPRLPSRTIRSVNSAPAVCWTRTPVPPSWPPWTHS